MQYLTHYIKFKMWSALFYLNSSFFRNSSIDSKWRCLNVDLRLYKYNCSSSTYNWSNFENSTFPYLLWIGKTGKSSTESHSKIPIENWIFEYCSTISDKNSRKNCYLDNFVFLTPSSLLTMLRNNDQNLRQARLWVEKQWTKLVSSYVMSSETMSKTCIKVCCGFAILHRGRGWISNTLFKIPLIFWNFPKKKRKVRFYACCFK